MLEEIIVDLLGSLVSLILVGGVSFVAFYKAYSYRKKRASIKDTPTSKIRSMAVGPVEVKGKAKKINEEELLEHPVLDRKCLAYKVFERDGEGGQKGSGLEEKFCNFKIEDETGEVGVYTDEDSEIAMKKHGINEDREGDEFMWVNVRKSISAVFPGSEVLVLGEAKVKNSMNNYESDNEDRLYLTGTEDNELYISDCDNKEDLIEQVYEGRYNMLLAVGAFFGIATILFTGAVIYFIWLLFYILIYV